MFKLKKLVTALAILFVIASNANASYTNEEIIILEGALQKTTGYTNEEINLLERFEAENPDAIASQQQEERSGYGKTSAKELMNSGYKPIEFLSSNKAGAVTVILKKGESYWYCWMLLHNNSRCWEVR